MKNLDVRTARHSALAPERTSRVRVQVFADELLDQLELLQRKLMTLQDFPRFPMNQQIIRAADNFFSLIRDRHEIGQMLQQRFPRIRRADAKRIGPLDHFDNVFNL